MKIRDGKDSVNSGRARVKVFQEPSDTCPRVSVNLWYRDGHCKRFLRLPDSASGHIVLANFTLCAPSVLRSIVEFCDHFDGSSKTFVRVSLVSYGYHTPSRELTLLLSSELTLNCSKVAFFVHFLPM